MAAKIAIGKTLDEIDNQVTGTTKACFEPALDYCVVKIPRWPFDKFESGDRTLFTQMKATGEVMAIDRSFEAAFMKAIRGLEVKQKDLWHEKFAGSRKTMGVTTQGEPPMPDDLLKTAIRVPTDERLWAIAEGLRREWTVEEINQLSRVDPWFLNKLKDLVAVEQALLHLDDFATDPALMDGIVRRAFELGFAYDAVARLLGISGEFMADLKRQREVFRPLASEQWENDFTQAIESLGSKIQADVSLKQEFDTFWEKYDSASTVIQARLYAAGKVEKYSGWSVFKMVDTCAGEFESKTPYYYSTLGDVHDTLSTTN